MKKDLMAILVCPVCKGKLELKTETETRIKSDPTKRFGFAVLKPNRNVGNDLV